MSSLVGFIYTFWCSLSSTSSILEQTFQSVHHLQMTSSEGFQNHFSIISKFVDMTYRSVRVRFLLEMQAILPETSPFLFAQMVVLSSFFQMFIVLGMYNFGCYMKKCSFYTYLFYCTDMIFYQFKCHLSYHFRYRFSCLQSQKQTDSI